MHDSTVSDCVFRFKNGSNCAQAVLTTYFSRLGLDENLAHRMGAGLGTGIGRMQYVCGAVNAGALVLSAVYGNKTPEDSAGKEFALRKVSDFINDFEREFRSSQCRELTGMDLSTPDGRDRAKAAGVFDTICVSCLEKVCSHLDADLKIE